MLERKIRKINNINNKIVSIFYVIYGNDTPIYVGYTNRTIGQRFKEHQKDKDFSSYSKVEVKEVDRLEFAFTWDRIQVNDNAKQVSDRESELINQYGTGNSLYQKGLGDIQGGQTWASVKGFIHSNTDNPKYRKMNSYELLTYLDNYHKRMTKIHNFIGNYQDSNMSKLNNFIKRYQGSEISKLRNFIGNYQEYKVAKLKNFINGYKYPEVYKLNNFINGYKDTKVYKLRNFIGNYKEHEAGAYKLQNFIISYQEPRVPKLRNFINHYHDYKLDKLSGFIGNYKDYKVSKLLNFISHYQRQEVSKLSSFIYRYRDK